MTQDVDLSKCAAAASKIITILEKLTPKEGSTAIAGAMMHQVMGDKNEYVTMIMDLIEAGKQYGQKEATTV